MADEPNSEAFIEKKRIKVTNEFNEIIKEEEKANEEGEEYGDEEEEGSEKEEETKVVEKDAEPEVEPILIQRCSFIPPIYGLTDITVRLMTMNKLESIGHKLQTV